MAWADDQSGEIKGATILDNQLSHLDNVAYKIKFFMIHSDHPIQGSELDEEYLKRVNSIIIAETGVTSGFYIKDVGFSNVVSARMQILPLGITGQLNIIEPYGMSFYEKLVIASAQLGIKSHLFEEIIDNYKLTKGVLLDTELDSDDWDGLIKNFKNLILEKTKKN